MCGIFGIVSEGVVSKSDIKLLARHSEQRGKDSSGIALFNNNKLIIHKAHYRVTKLIDELTIKDSNFVFGHSRLITNGNQDNQPVLKNNLAVVHNGIIVNADELWRELNLKRELEIDTEIIAAIALKYFSEHGTIEGVSTEILRLCKGVVACAIILPGSGEMVLFSNNGSLYLGNLDHKNVFASERFGLEKLNCLNISQVKDEVLIHIPINKARVEVNERTTSRLDHVKSVSYNKLEASILEHSPSNLVRCKKCILPETMPFIEFDEKGVCNYCNNYIIRNKPRPVDEMLELIQPYRRPGNELDCIVPFSGGRDSCYSLHLIVNELKMKPVTYTYDWGMVTDLGRRNISRMCSSLGVENIIVAADIEKKRRNIKLNLSAWLKNPNLGMLALLTAGDKHFFRHVEEIKKQTNINLNLWGVNPLEITHFKAGFLGVPPYFKETKVYNNGWQKQVKYHTLRFKAMLESPGYFNKSLFDTLSGEYYRSFKQKQDYFHVFDYWKWDENEVNNCLLNEYQWEKAVDTSTTWRIGDGTAAFYNYIYYTVAGFSEHDTFRSNQIREGQISREEALKLVNDENMPRYENIKWYLDILNFDFNSVIKRINEIPKIYYKR